MGERGGLGRVGRIEGNEREGEMEEEREYERERMLHEMTDLGYILLSELNSPEKSKFDGFASAIGFHDKSLFIGSSTSNTVYVHAPNEKGQFRVVQVLRPKDSTPSSLSPSSPSSSSSSSLPSPGAMFGCSISVMNDFGEFQP